MKNLKILHVDPDKSFVTVIQHYLEDEGVVFHSAHDTETCMEILQQEDYDVILVDPDSSDSDAMPLIPKLRMRHNSVIIILSTKTDPMDRIIALEMGANDYMVKPFEIRELRARIKAHTRLIDRIIKNATEGESDSIEEIPTHIYRFNGWIYDSGKLSLYDSQDTHTELTSNECALLQIFLNSNGKVLSREQLYKDTRGEDLDEFDRSIDIQVTRLRKKIGDDAANPTFIKTIRGIGYMFVADVKVEEEATAA